MIHETIKFNGETEIHGTRYIYVSITRMNGIDTGYKNMVPAIYSFHIFNLAFGLVLLADAKQEKGNG